MIFRKCKISIVADIGYLNVNDCHSKNFLDKTSLVSLFSRRVDAINHLLSLF